MQLPTAGMLTDTRRKEAYEKFDVIKRNLIELYKDSKTPYDEETAADVIKYVANKLTRSGEHKPK